MELHHIVQEAEGGEDKFENCVPLCFDCHSDMRSYDHQHPKGTKYTPSELRAHRDAWYAKVKNSAAVGTSSDYISLDRQTFARVQRLLPWDGTISFVRHNNFAGFSFRLEKLDDFSRFRMELEDPAFEFMDADLEALRAELVAAIRRFDKVIAFETFPTHNSGMNTVPPDWETDQPERFERVVPEIHGSTQQICDTYDELVKVARRKLTPAKLRAG